MRGVIIVVLFVAMLSVAVDAAYIPPPPSLDSNAVPSCSDFVLNGDETGPDCGGSCVAEGKKCNVGVSCQYDDDCGSNICTTGVCSSSGVGTPRETAPDDDGSTNVGSGGNTNTGAGSGFSTGGNTNAGAGSGAVPGSTNDIKQQQAVQPQQNPEANADDYILVAPGTTMSRKQLETLCRDNTVGMAYLGAQKRGPGSLLVAVLTALIAIETVYIVSTKVKSSRRSENDDALKQYCQTHMARGVSRDQLYNHLRNQGIEHDSIMEAMR